LEQAEVIRKTHPLTQTAQLVIATTIIFSATEVNNFALILKEVDMYLENYDSARVKTVAGS